MIKLLSDLHLDHNSPGEYFHPGEGDILILAGDILQVEHLKSNGYYSDIYNTFLNECSKNFNHVLYVLGNHEYYSYTIEKSLTLLREKVPNNFHVLQNDCVEINGIHFIGFTLWTNFFNENPFEMWEAKGYMNDYSKIRIGASYKKLQPYHLLELHNESISFLKSKLKDLQNERVFVISHHSPTLQSISEKYKSFRCNGSFCSDYDDLIIQNPNIKNWVFGHVHSKFDFYIEQCRMTSNPRGYPRETTDFDLNFTIEL
jgi:predicted MPP superfamily phosphohydrolase